jgi:hypothetical protein
MSHVRPESWKARVRNQLRVGVFAVVAILALGATDTSAATVGVVGSGTTVRPHEHPTTWSNVNLSAARNEFESFQVVIDTGAAGAALNNLSLSASVLTGPGPSIPATNVSLYREEYYTVVRPSDGELGLSPQCTPSSACRFPDALIPDRDPYYNEQRSAFPFSVPSGENRAVWVDILVPAGQTPGTYAGTLAVKENAATIATVTIALQVVNINLPSTSSLRGYFMADPGRLAFAHGTDAACAAFDPLGCTWDDMPGGLDGAWELYSKYVVAGLNNRLTLSQPGLLEPEPGGNLERFQTWAEPLLNGTGPTKLAGARLTDMTLDQNHVSAAGDWNTEATNAGFLDRVTFLCDEIVMDPDKWANNCDTPYRIAEQGWDALPATLAGTIVDFEYGDDDTRPYLADDAMRTLIVLVPRMDVKPGYPGYPGQLSEGSQRSRYNDYLAADPERRLWLYTSCQASGCGWDYDPVAHHTGWPSYHIDQPPSEARAMPWQIFNYKGGNPNYPSVESAGEMHFEALKNLPTAWTPCSTPFPPSEPAWPATHCLYYDGANGDGTLFYPGRACAGTPPCIGGTKDIPVESIRLKRIRDGREDYEYLLKAKAVDETKTRAIAGGPGITGGLFPTMYESNTQTDADLKVARCRLVALIILIGNGCASYARPRGATPFRASLVPAFKQCAAPNRAHGAPLSYSSCKPPIQESGYATIGSPDANSNPANSIGSLTLAAVTDNTGTAQDETDVKLTGSITDVRKRDLNLTDYTGQLQVATSLRITDKLNGTPTADDGTVTDQTYPATMTCAQTADTTIGSTCQISTTANAIAAGTVSRLKRTIWQLGQIKVFDGGADGALATQPNTLFAVQGVFVP